MYLYFILALQGYCIYHVWKNRRPYFWMFVIIFIPLVGSIVYILTQVINKSEVEKIQKEMTTIVNPSKKIIQLEAAVDFSDTYQNRVVLADAHFENRAWELAVTNYNAALEGNFKTDFYLNSKLLEAYYRQEKYDLAIERGEIIKNDPQFEKNTVAFYFGLALDKMDRSDEAQTYLSSVDRRYSNFSERVVLAEHYVKNKQIQTAKNILEDLHTESQNMSKDTLKLFRDAFTKAERIRATL